MSKIRSFFARVQTMSFKMMWLMITKISEESGKSKILIACDMIWCAFRYGVGYLEYRVFGWVYVKGRNRKTFMKMQDNLNVYKILNNEDYLKIFEDKIKFNQRFNKYIGRTFLDLRNSSLDEFIDFCSTQSVIFAKEIDGFGGVGAKKISLSDYPDSDKLRALFEDLKRNKLFVVEECVVQCDELNKLCSSSINTIRITTVLAENGPHIMYSLIRMSNGKKAVDNISSGGMYAPVDENGVLFKPAFCDKTGELYPVHPFTKTEIVGFKIPNYKDCINLVKKAALEVPQIGYVGWDVAISDKGPILIEGNTLPGYDMPQNYYHLKDAKVGILSQFKDLVKI